MFQKIKHINAVSFFTTVAIVFEIIYNLVTPALQAPDEFNHFYRAYQVSQGNFLPQKQDQRLGGEIPQGVIDFVDQYKQCDYIWDYTISYREILNSMHVTRNEETRFQDFANTAYYSPVSYLPQAIVLFILRLFDSSPALLYYLGRLSTFVIWLFVMRFVIVRLPVFQWLFALLALLPMNLYIVNSFSADTVTNLLCIIFITTILQHIFVTPQINTKQLLWLILIITLLALAKVIYVGLLVLIFAIPATKFKSKYYRFGCIALLMATGIITAAIWSGQVMQLYIAGKDYNPLSAGYANVSPCGDYYAQKNYIIEHPGYFFEVVKNSLLQRPERYLWSYIGVFGHLDILLPEWIYVLTYITLILVAVTEKNILRLRATMRIIFLAAAIAAVLLLLLSQQLLWDCVGSGMVELLQGRYLIPMFVLLFLTLNVTRLQLKINPAWIIAPLIILLNSYSCYVIYHRFFTAPPAEITEIYCDAEQTAGKRFQTSHPGTFLEGGQFQTANLSHAGKHSAELGRGWYCFNLNLKVLHARDLVEIEAWKFGGDALLMIAGKNQADNSEFSFGGGFKGGLDETGWRRIKTVYQLPYDSKDILIYAWNARSGYVCLDDFNIKITHFTGRRFERP